MIGLVLALINITTAPSPQPRIEWRTYETAGFILCAPPDTARVNRRSQPCLILPPGSYLVVPMLTTEPDPEEGRRKS